MFHSRSNIIQINEAYSQFPRSIDANYWQNGIEDDSFESESCEELSLSTENISDIYEQLASTNKPHNRKTTSLLPNEVYETIMKLLYLGYNSKDVIKCIETIYSSQLSFISDYWRDILGYLPIPSQCIYFSHCEPLLSIPMVYIPYNSSPKFRPFYITLKITPFEDVSPSITTLPDSSYTQMDCLEDPDYELLGNQIISITSSIFETIPFLELTRIDLNVEDKEKMYCDYYLSALKNEHYQLYNIVYKMAEKYGLLLPKIDTTPFDFMI